ncbi:MAG: glycosyltransferase [bacterium]|nr:glycosyltransferase [bacterium]
MTFTSSKANSTEANKTGIGWRLPEITILTVHPHGDARVYTRQALSLAKVAQTVRLISPQEPGYTPPQSDGVEHYFVKRVRFRFEKFLVTPWRLLFAGLKRPASIICIHDAILLYLFPILRLFGKICIYDRHEDYNKVVRSRYWIPKPFRILAGNALYVFERFFGSFASGVISVVHPLEKIVPNCPSVVLHNFPGEQLIESGKTATTPPSKREYDVVHIGSMTDSRFGVYRAVLEGLVKRRPGFKALMIVTSERHYKILVDQFDEKQVTVLRRIPHPEVTAKLAQCKLGIAIFPTLEAHLQWAVPVKLFEYMACGCAFVTSHMPGFESLLREEDKKDVHIVNSADPEPYIREIDAMLNNPAEMDCQGVMYQKWVAEYYNWRHEEEKLYRFFTELTKKSKS